MSGNMRTIKEDSALGTQFIVIKDLTAEPVWISFKTQIDDVIINSPDGDVLISWDVETWDEDNSFLVPGKNDVKELNNVRCTHMFVAAAPWVGKTIRVWITVQRN